MNSSERRIKLMLLLQNPGKKLTVQEMATHFNVSRRTIFRDLNSLEKMKIPVTWDQQRGYGMMSGYKIPPLMFTDKELATIMVGINFVKSQVDKQMVKDASGVELKIRNVLPPDLKDFMESLESRTIVDPYLKFGAEKKDGGDWYRISLAIAQRKRLQFAYTTKDGKTNTRKVDPYILVFFDDHWNLIAKSHLRGEKRSFILDQMRELKILDEKIRSENNIDIEALIFDSNNTKHEIRVDIEKSEIERFKANLPAKIIRLERKSPNFFQVVFHFDNIDFLNEWLLQFGRKVRIQSPDELKKKRTTILRQMLED